MTDTSDPVSIERVGSIAVVRIDNPPLNIGNARLRAALADAFDRVAAMSATGLVLTSALDDFYSGSDIKEFDGEIASPELPDVIERMDRLDVPIVAAIAGNVLGGGLELALAADYRIAAESLRTGFPEAGLGLIPGAGGTVRAARLIGIPATIELVATSAQLGAEAAREIGLVDEIVAPEELIARSLAVVGRTPKRRLRDAVVPAPDELGIQAAVDAVLTRRVRPHVRRVTELIRSSARLDGADALVAERALFLDLRGGQEARSLRYLFFATRAAAKSVRSHGSPGELRRVGIAGAGTMGSSIARSCADAGLAVVLFDSDERARERARALLSEAVGDVRIVDELDVLGQADLVIDAVFEDTAVKRSLLAGLDAALPEDVVIASNTSYLDLNSLGDALADASRFAGLHFFNPADRNALVEIVRPERASERALATLAALAARLGKTAIPARVGEGFVANRVYTDYRGQAEILLEDGASPQQVDSAMRAFGMPIGPFAVGDLSGLDIAWSRRRRLAADRDPAQRYVSIPDLICEAGRLGRKSGAGYYDYPASSRHGIESAFVTRIIEDERERKGIVPRSIPEDEIVRRCVAAMVIAAAEVVAAGVAERASDVDVALTTGFGFPRWEGGPLRYAAVHRDEWLEPAVSEVYRSDPIGYATATPSGAGLPAALEAVLARVR